MIVNDGICPSGYSSTFTETECRELTGQTISNNEIGEFYYAGCSRFHPPAYTCFVGQQKPNPRTYYVTTTCGQTPNFDAVAHRVICKKLGNTFLTFTEDFNAISLFRSILPQQIFILFHQLQIEY